MDLLQHEMLISAFFCRLCVPFNRNHILLDLFSVNIIEMDLFSGKLRDFHISDIIYISGPVQDSRHIRGDQRALIAPAHDQRAVLSGCENFSRIILEHYSESIRAADTQHSTSHSFQRGSGLFIIVVNKLHRDFRIGLRIKSISGFCQLFFQFLIILNDPIMHQDHRSVI